MGIDKMLKVRKEIMKAKNGNTLKGKTSNGKASNGNGALRKNFAVRCDVFASPEKENSGEDYRQYLPRERKRVFCWNAGTFTKGLYK